MRFTRASFYLHLWIGVLSTVVLFSIAITGVLLNHKRPLGLMPDVAAEPSGPLGQALSVERLAAIALAAVPEEVRGGWKPGDAVDIRVIDRMDARPRNGYVKVRFRDKASTEATVDLVTGAVLHVGKRGDVFLEKLHSGEAFGDWYILLSDFAAVALVVTLITGYWLWLAPRLAHSRRDEGGGGTAS